MTTPLGTIILGKRCRQLSNIRKQTGDFRIHKKGVERVRSYFREDSHPQVGGVMRKHSSSKLRLMACRR